jgi:transposase
MSQIVFIDETAITSEMTRRCGRGPKGHRVVAHETLGAWKTYTLVAAICSTGWSAAMTLKGAMDANAFVTYVEQCLVPTLKRGQIVVLDNVSSHHDDRVRPLIQAAGASLYYLPPYSPDLNPIENAFSQLKATLKKLRETTFDGLTTAIGKTLKATSPLHCRNFFIACGYH